MHRPAPGPMAKGKVPTRDELLAFIKESATPVGKREIARAFGIQGGDRIWLKQMLSDLEQEGTINRRRKAVHKADRLPPVVKQSPIAPVSFDRIHPYTENQMAWLTDE